MKILWFEARFRRDLQLAPEHCDYRRMTGSVRQRWMGRGSIWDPALVKKNQGGDDVMGQFPPSQDKERHEKFK